MVRLKPTATLLYSVKMFNFNPTMVRLKLRVKTAFNIISNSFQSHNGSIKTTYNFFYASDFF